MRIILNVSIMMLSLLFAVESSAQQGFDRSLRVGFNGGDFGTLEDALGSINDSSASRQIELILAPGVHVLGQPTNLPPFVHLSGSGVGVTVIAGRVDGNLLVLDGEASGSRFSLRNLTVINRANGATALRAQRQARLVLNDVEIVAKATDGNATAIELDDFVVLTAENSNVRAVAGESAGFGIGIFNLDSRIIMNDSRVVVSGFDFATGILASGAARTISEIDDSLIAATGVVLSVGVRFGAFESGLFNLNKSQVIASTRGRGESVGIVFQQDDASSDPGLSFRVRYSTIIGENFAFEETGSGIVNITYSSLSNGVSSDGSVQCRFSDAGLSGPVLSSTCD